LTKKLIYVKLQTSGRTGLKEREVNMLKKSFYLLPVLLLSVFAIGLFSLPGIAQPCPGNCSLHTANAYGYDPVKSVAEAESIAIAEETCEEGCGGVYCYIISTTCQYNLQTHQWQCTTLFRYCGGTP
jgi:hypothetical protein